MNIKQERGLTPPSTNKNSGTGTENWYERPHEELVADIRSVVTQARTSAEKKGQPFDPIMWVGEQLMRSIWSTSGEARRNRSDTSLVWDAISHPYIQDKEYKRAVEDVLRLGTAERKSNLVTLDPEAVKLIDAMADAVGVPHRREQTTFDLLTDEQKKLFRIIHPRIAREKGI